MRVLPAGDAGGDAGPWSGPNSRPTSLLVNSTSAPGSLGAAALTAAGAHFGLANGGAGYPADYREASSYSGSGNGYGAEQYPTSMDPNNTVNRRPAGGGGGGGGGKSGGYPAQQPTAARNSNSSNEEGNGNGDSGNSRKVGKVVPFFYKIIKKILIFCRLFNF